jgi:peptide-methionine (R)-S-oxide reductase
MHRPLPVAARWLGLALTLAACNGPSPSVAAEPAVAQTPLAVPVDAPKVGEKLELTDAEWKAKLPPEVYHVMREGGTERAFTGRDWDRHDRGVYRCAACGAPLFSSDTKFESGTGWPSFYQPVEKGRVSSIEDRSVGMVRTEVRCARCGGHLGHVFDDGPRPTGERYCINSASLKFEPAP